MNYNTKQFDVIILGSGLAGSILATILARHNIQVLMIDKGSHPRFAVGEAMTPDTDLMMSILSYQYDVPEIAHLSSFKNICENISPSACGLKRSFNFIYHREGQKQTLQEANKVGVHPSSHLFRQDIDHYMAKVAVKYGVKLLENTSITDIKIESKGIELEVESGESFTANYLVDASGYRSPLSQKFNLREIPTRFKTHSRSIFTHMVDVKRYDDCVRAIAKSSDELFWYQGTLHHIFDGGWMWVIPFNNHENSGNPNCSVGLNFDSRRFPKTEISPEQEFKNFLTRFPDIAIQFENAKPIRQWVSTDRLQYSSHSCVGERFYVLSHAAGFIDALYSFGLVNTCTIIIPLASQIMKAIAENDYSAERFTDIEHLQQKLFDYNDTLVNCSYISFADFNLWDAWRRIWILGSFMRQAKAGLKKKLKIAAGKGKELFDLNSSNLDSLTPSFEGLGDNFFRNATTIVEKVSEGLLSANEAATHIMGLINSVDFVPSDYYKLGDPSQKNIDGESDFIASEHKRFMFWVKSSQKPEVKKYFDYDIEDLLAIANLNTAKR
ncbi:MAG TPA: FAD-dependent oxidoreductase [Cyanobacteria bacterium UBA11369]|nr:FAD-dependent oxidoreductase [Cyanobacteria bacterium UBA11371]HBE34026.1 FAD-dependent oxidoreductase [Cyanobacteria bacterium UBA11368]HBE54317.1 FAD-dependent oxidoreductase [Cyanobacteria bacterium UBA11369]